ncbi:MAG: hypothetical protein IPM57_07440 [Oligoflexia bacterium]|nr:hypothetical protein [Oligoflexia bacterium]
MKSKILFVTTLIMLTNFQLNFAEATVMRHNIREIMTLDVEDMERLVNKEINSKEKNDDVFFNQSAQVLTQTVLVHPRFSERQAALARLKSKMLNEEFVEVMRRSFDMLLSLLEDKSVAPSDEASALVALTNLVIEARQMTKEDFKPQLEKVVKADIEISDEARNFGREPLKNLISPSLEAKASL